MGVDTYVGFEATTQFLTLSTYLKLVLLLSSFYSTELLFVLHEDSLFSSNLDAVDSHDVELSLRNTAEPSTRLITTSRTSSALPQISLGVWFGWVGLLYSSRGSKRNFWQFI